MGFKELLRDITCACDGAVGALMMGYDGIAVDEYHLPKESWDPQLISVEYASLVKSARRAADSLGGGELEEVTLTSEMARVVIRNVDREYFVALILNHDANLGRARYLLQGEALKLKEELH